MRSNKILNKNSKTYNNNNKCTHHYNRCLKSFENLILVKMTLQQLFKTFFE